MLRAIRRTRFASLLSVATLVCAVSLSASTLLHSDNDDAICNPAIVQDQAAHRIGGEAAPTSNFPEHCAVCHWLSLRTVETEALADLSGAETFRLFSITVLPFSSATATRRPARAPPSV